MNQFWHWRARVIPVFLLLLSTLFPSAAHAIPPANQQLQPANGYGSVSFKQVSPTTDEIKKGAKVCYQFVVTNTQQPLAGRFVRSNPFPPNKPVTGYGIKGLVVYHSTSPLSISSCDRTSMTLYQSNHQYSWWDHNGSEDTDNNGLQDRVIEPTETQPGPSGPPGPIVYYTDPATYRLCYSQPIDPAQYKFGLHVVEPFTQETFFSHVNAPKPSLAIEKSANTYCVKAGSPVTYSYKVTNTGSVTVTNIQVNDDKLGVIGTIASLAGGASETLTKQTTLSVSTTNVATATGSPTVSATSNPVFVKVVNPRLQLTASISPACIPSGGSATVEFVLTNTGDVAVNNVSVTASADGGAAQPVGSVASLAPAASKTFSKTFTNLTAATTTIVGLAQGTSAECGCAVNATANAVTVKTVKPKLEIVKSVDLTCVPTGASVTYSYKVKNAGDVTVTAIKVTDSVLGLIDTIASLAPNAEAILTKTTTINATVTNTATAVGVANCSGSTVSATSNAVTVTVANPKVTVSLTAEQINRFPGDQAKVTYTVTNTGDVALTGVTLNLTSPGSNSISPSSPISVGNLAAGASATGSVTITYSTGRGNFTVNASVSGGSECAEATATGSTPVELTWPVIKGQVYSCGKLHPGITVSLLDSNDSLVATSVTDANGAYLFDRDSRTPAPHTRIPDGAYILKVVHPDYQTATVGITYNDVPDVDVVQDIFLKALDIGFQVREAYHGRVFFSDSDAFTKLAATKPGIEPKEPKIVMGPQTEADADLRGADFGDLMNIAFRDPGFDQKPPVFTISYRYYGYVPGHAEMGLFDANRPLYMIMDSPLVAGNVWNSTTASFRNLVYLSDRLRNLPLEERVPGGSYTIRMLFSQPFNGLATPQGTAYDYQTHLELDLIETTGLVTMPSGVRLPSSQWTSPAGPAPANLSTIPPGWMAQTAFQFRQRPGHGFLMYGAGSYRNICGTLVPFRIHPEGEPSPPYSED